VWSLIGSLRRHYRLLTGAMDWQCARCGVAASSDYPYRTDAVIHWGAETSQHVVLHDDCFDGIVRDCENQRGARCVLCDADSRGRLVTLEWARSDDQQGRCVAHGVCLEGALPNVVIALD
jgi:hypothetical protein